MARKHANSGREDKMTPTQAEGEMVDEESGDGEGYKERRIRKWKKRAQTWLL